MCSKLVTHKTFPTNLINFERMILNSKHRKLRKGSGFHLDLLIAGKLTAQILNA
jgi:hypothetical protein